MLLPVNQLLVFKYFILYVLTFISLFFFFSSRRRHTRLTCDWSSDVCSSDLPLAARHLQPDQHAPVGRAVVAVVEQRDVPARADRGEEVRAGARALRKLEARSEERRVGKECRSRWSREQSKKNESKKTLVSNR